MGTAIDIRDRSKLILDGDDSSASAMINDEICQASPDEINIKVMKEWNVPTRDAARVLSEWRSFHNQNKHDIVCPIEISLMI